MVDSHLRIISTLKNVAGLLVAISYGFILKGWGFVQGFQCKMS